MLFNYFLTTWRQIRNKPGFYLLNIGGLAIGIAAFLIMFEYSRFQLSFDKHHDRSEDIYRLNLHSTPEGREPYHGAAVFAGVGPALVQDFPQVENATRIVKVNSGGIVKLNEKQFIQDEIFFAEPSLFDVFSIQFLEGTSDKALKEVSTVVISEALRNKLFTSRDVVGQTLSLTTDEGKQDYRIDGVFQNRDDTHFQADILISWKSQELLELFDLETNWRFFDFVTYVKLQPGTAGMIEDKMPSLIDKHREPGRGSSLFSIDLMPVADIHLQSHYNQEISSNGDINSIRFLLIFAVLILTIAWINYINLYTAKAIERGKEVGVRKTLGSSRSQLRIQFLVEAATSNFIATFLGVVMAFITAPLIYALLNSDFQLIFPLSARFWRLVLSIWLISTAFSGIYPAWFVSNFNVLKAIKSIAPSASGRLRRGLVIWQFLASSALIIGAAIVYFQLTEMNKQPLGIITDDTVVIEAPNYTGSSDSYYRLMSSFKGRVSSLAGVEGASYASDVPGRQIGWRGSTSRIGQNFSTGTELIYKATIDKDYLDIYDIDLLAGRDFQFSSDSNSVIINEEALALYGFDSPEMSINKRLAFSGMDTMRVIGVVENYYQESLKEPIKPTAFFMIKWELSNISIKYSGDDFKNFITQSEKLFHESFPELPFIWESLSERLMQRHGNESRFLDVFGLVVLLSLVISALGLIGLASYAAEKRRKEISIRKVLGSSVSQVARLVLIDFLKLAGIGNLVAIPLIYFVSNQWLNQFSFRIDFIWWLPLMSFLICILLVAFSTIYHILKVARVNPALILGRE